MIFQKINADSVPEKIDYVFHFAGLSDLDEQFSKSNRYYYTEYFGCSKYN